MDTIKDRLIKYIDFKDVSRREFCRSIGVSPTFLANNSEIGSNKLINIFITYPDLSMAWLILGEGMMLKTESSTKVVNKDIESFYKELITQKDKRIEEQAETIGSLKQEVQHLKTQAESVGRGAEDADCAAVG